MFDEIVKRLRELQVITEHCAEQSCDECENIKLCDKYDNKTLSGTYKEAADVIEELQATLCNWCAVCPEGKRDLSTCEIYESCRAKPPKKE